VARETREISVSAFRRLQRLQQAYLTTVERLRAGDDYPDFFVEGSGPPWHEMWPEVITGEKEFSDERMLFIDRLGQDDYPDFFVEGSGPPWHEMWPEVVTGERFDPSNIQHRMRALRQLNVVQAYMRLQERAESK
jgi:hypothetical protein